MTTFYLVDEHGDNFLIFISNVESSLSWIHSHWGVINDIDLSILSLKDLLRYTATDLAVPHFHVHFIIMKPFSIHIDDVTYNTII